MVLIWWLLFFIANQLLRMFFMLLRPFSLLSGFNSRRKVLVHRPTTIGHRDTDKLIWKVYENFRLWEVLIKRHINVQIDTHRRTHTSAIWMYNCLILSTETWRRLLRLRLIEACNKWRIYLTYVALLYLAMHCVTLTTPDLLWLNFSDLFQPFLTSHCIY